MSQPYSERKWIIHPSAVILLLILLGIATLFLALSLAYVYSRVDRGMQSIHVPMLFIFNTFVLLFSSFCVQRCRHFIEKKSALQGYRWAIWTVLSGTAFLALQGLAWYQMLAHHLSPGLSRGHGFLYAISMLHFLHVLAGLPFLLRLTLQLRESLREGTESLVMISDVYSRKLKLTSWYWHFIDVVWIYLICFLLINSMI